jgi:SAM-dependent methyltransferase
VSEASPDLERLLALVRGFRSTQVVYVIAKLRLADHLAEGPLTAEELASRVDVDPENLGRVLRLAAFYGLVTELAEGQFELTPLAQPLRGDVDDSIAANAVMLGQEHYRAWASLLHSVRSGESAFQHVYGIPMFDYLAQHADAQADFDAAMGVGTEVVLKSMVDVYDFSKSRVIVDVGGGNGSVSAMILKRNPAMEAVVYDQPQVLEAAERYLSEAGVRARCRLVPGNFFESVPQGGDIYFLSNIVHDWDDERALRILRNCRAAMTPAAAVLLLETILPEHGHPSEAAMGDVNMMVMLTGRERTAAQYRKLLADADLQLRKVVAVSAHDSLIEARPR